MSHILCTYLCNRVVIEIDESESPIKSDQVRSSQINQINQIKQIKQINQINQISYLITSVQLQYTSVLGRPRSGSYIGLEVEHSIHDHLYFLLKPSRCACLLVAMVRTLSSRFDLTLTSA